MDTASEANSSVIEEGVYPLPDTASEISDDYSPNRIRGRELKDGDTGMEADMEEEESLDQNTDEFTPEEVSIDVLHYLNKVRGRELEDGDTGMEADMEEESLDQNTDEFTPEEVSNVL